MDKKSLRYTLLQARQSIDESTRNTLENSACEHLSSLLSALKPSICGLYMPIKHEISPIKVCTIMEIPIIWALPVVNIEKQVMHFHFWQRGDALQKGAYDITEPVQQQPVIPDVVVVPLLGVDETGGRLGYGKGYYDKYFTYTAPKARRVGLAFSCQVIESIPTEPHDMPLHDVVTDKGIVQISAANY